MRTLKSPDVLTGSFQPRLVARSHSPALASNDARCRRDTVDRSRTGARRGRCIHEGCSPNDSLGTGAHRRVLGRSCGWARSRFRAIRQRRTRATINSAANQLGRTWRYDSWRGVSTSGRHRLAREASVRRSDCCDIAATDRSVSPWSRVPPNGPELTRADPRATDYSACDAASCGFASGAAWS